MKVEPDQAVEVRAGMLRLQAARLRFVGLVMQLRGADADGVARARLPLRLATAWLRLLRETAAARRLLGRLDR